MNADDPEAALAAVRLAMAYRQEFGHDVVVDLIGYRRFGHNEQDEAAYTQPLMVQQIAAQQTVRERYSARLIEEGVVTPDEAEAVFQRTQAELRAAHERLKASIAAPPQPREGRIPADTGEAVVTAVPADRLRQLNEQLLSVPDGFEANAKLLKQLERRREAVAEGGIDWGQAEGLAFASLLTEGIPIRLSGQDTERGTFSHRHAVLHDQRTGETYAPIQNLPEASASMEIYNSPLSEFACLGFEYGYAVAAPDALVLWEAQFGDFVNGAQIVIDQFLVAGLSKWGQTSRLTLLLPHGYEGNGPEHSSAKLERFLQLAAQENIRVANCTTAAQYFHLLRRQALDATARPLVVMTPKGLLRLKQASSTLEDLSEGRFQPVIDDPQADKGNVTRLVLCSGKIYYDIQGHEDRARASSVAVARLEQLYPFPVEPTAALTACVPESARARVGAGRAAEHGRLADDPSPPGGCRARRSRGPVRRPSLAGEPERGLSHSAPPRAGPDRPPGARGQLAGRVHRPSARKPWRQCCASSTGSPPSRWGWSQAARTTPRGRIGSRQVPRARGTSSRCVTRTARASWPPPSRGISFERGLTRVVAPILSNLSSPAVADGEFSFTVYPLIDGRTGVEAGLVERHWLALGDQVRRLHATVLPSDLSDRLATETFRPAAVDVVRQVDLAVSGRSVAGPVAEEVAGFWATHRAEILALVERTEELGPLVEALSLPLVLCHADLHTWNVLIDRDGEMWLIDWDEVVLAPKERDLMFVVGGIGAGLIEPHETAWFFEGYGEATVEPLALSYYRHAWAVQDIGGYGERVFLDPSLGDDSRSHAAGILVGLFGPGEIVELAQASASYSLSECGAGRGAPRRPWCRACARRAVPACAGPAVAAARGDTR